MSTKYVYWEKQDSTGRMCGLHCINSILQGPYYSEDMLAVIGKELDDQEKEFLKCPPNSNLASPDSASSDELVRHNSSNVLDDGFINISVLVECLKRKNILLKNVSETDLTKIITNDHHQDIGYICNLNEHWFSVRKIHNTWYILDSLKNAPLYIKDVQLKFYFNDVIKKYHVFTVHNENPYVSLPKPNINFEAKNPNQRYIPVNVIKEVSGTADGFIKEDCYESASGGSIYKFSNREKKENFKWPESGGRKLNDNKNESGNNGYTLGNLKNENGKTEEDHEMQLALKLSMQEFAKNLPPPVEIEDGEKNCTTIMVKFSKRKIQKKFSFKQTIEDVFYWIEYESAKDNDINDSLLFRNKYNIHQVFPRRKFTKERDVSIELHSGNKAEQVMHKTLEELNFENEEVFIVS